jgi:ankyrin repeat protein
MADADVHTHTSSAPCAASGAVEARQATQRLLEAARDGSLEDFSLAEKSFPAEDLAAVKEGLGRNALHMAALGGQLDICNYLVLDRGFDIDQVDEQGEYAACRLAWASGRTDADHMVACAGNTPLKHALMQKQPGTVHKLLQLGADARVTVGNDPAPIHYAAASGATCSARCAHSVCCVAYKG